MNVCKRKKTKGALITREELDEIQSCMLNAVDKAIVECLFIGVAGKNLEDLTSVCRSQLDDASGVLTLVSGKRIPLTPEQCNLLQTAFDEEELHSYGPEQQTSMVKGFGQLYKRKPNARDDETADRKFRWVMRQLAIWRVQFNRPYLTMKSITMSGLVHELKLGMDRTGLSLREYLRSPEGQGLAALYDYKNAYYVDVIVNKVKEYMPE